MRLSAYYAYAKKQFLSRSAYRFDHLMGILSTCLQFFIFYEIYRTLYGSKESVDGITMSMITTNFVLSLGLSAIFSPNDYFVPGRIWDGSISTELLRPMSFKGRMIAENVGDACFNLIFKFIPVLLIAIFTTGMEKPAGIGNMILFLISAILGYGVLWTISFLVQMTAFWLINIWSLITIKDVFVNVLSGMMIPLWFMPDWMAGVIKFTPFASIYFTPVQIYLGQLSISEIVFKCGVQLFWTVIIYALGNVLWNKGQKKLVVQGG
ncbi:MAG: ABC-2 family transporter protein [Lachnospiraceae bacterium]|nr:ABC-2 family transporter protein [Lachnospiraceae bacterium]